MSASSVAAYREQFAKFSNNGGGEGPAWLPALRARAFDRFEALGFPTMRNEDWHYTSVAPIAETTFAPGHELPRIATPERLTATLELVVRHRIDQWPRLVFVNGRFAAGMSTKQPPNGVEVLTFSKALETAAEFMARELGAVASVEQNAFAALNTAFVTDGVVVRIPKDTVVEQPLHILWIADTEGAGAMITPRLLVDAGANSRVSIVESFVGAEDASYLTNAVAELRVGDGAHVSYYKLQRESTSAFHVGTMQATQGRDSVLHAFSFATGARLSRTNVYTSMPATGAEVRLNGLYLLDGQQHCDHQTFVHHAAESCASRELYKGILDGTSHGVFNGKVLVDAIAQKTDGKQTNHALLLSERAKIDTKPQLEIFADDVKCTHGATVGRLDDTALFYLKSRGINRDMARALLTYAFAAEVLETIEVPALREALKALAFDRYNRPHAN